MKTKRKKKLPPWVSELSCRFCGKVIVTAYDFSELDDSLSEEEREEITCGEGGYDDTGGSCEHLAFYSDWAYEGASIVNWEEEMAMLAKALDGTGEPDEDDDEDPDEDDDERDSDEDVADIISGYMIDDETFINKTLDKVLPDFDHETIHNYVEKFDGVRNGGPTYMMIFLRNKVQPEKD
jgi:hypothetical protein